MPAMPKTLGGTIDAMYRNILKQRELSKQLEALKKEYNSLEDHAFDQFTKDKLEGGKGKLAQASISRSEVPQVEDWDKLYAHIKRTGSWDLLQKRIGVTAVRARWDDKKNVPGVSSFTKTKLSLTKVAARK